MANVINRPIIDRDITAFPCTFVPNKDKTAVYKKYYNAYKNIYNAVRPIIAEIEKQKKVIKCQ